MPAPPTTRAMNADERRGARQTRPRAPAGQRGLKRYNALVDATAQLLESDDPHSVGLYQIAEAAGIPPASVYHFFPSKEAAFTALAMRVAEQLLEVHRIPIPADRIQSWQDLYRVDVLRAADFFNRNPAGMKILFGGFGGINGRDVDRAVTSSIACAAYERLDLLFHMPELPRAETLFENRLAILDAIWSLSVQELGRIDGQYLEESIRACLAYTHTFLPENLEVRDAHRLAGAQSLPVSLPSAPCAAAEEAPGDQEGD